MVKQTIWVTFWNHVMYILPSSVAQWIWQPPIPLNPIAPTLWEYLWQISLSFVIFDTYYASVHTLFHKVSFSWSDTCFNGLVSLCCILLCVPMLNSM